MSQYEVFKDICESTLIGYKSQIKRFNARDIADITFLYFIALQILKSSFKTVPFAIDYAHATNSSGFDSFRQSGTDLHVLLHILFGKNSQFTFELLNDQKASMVLRDKLSVNVPEVRKWLSNINNVNETMDQNFLLRIENGLQIDNSNYKSMRRLASEWTSLDESARKLVMTRLLQAFREKASRSELLPVLKKLAKQENLVMKDDNQGSKTGTVLKALGIGALAATGIGSYAMHRLLKNLGEPKK